MKTLTIEIKFDTGDALGKALQDIIDSIGEGSNSGKAAQTEQDENYVYEWSIKS